MAFVEPVVLESRNVRLLPLNLEHEAGIRAAANNLQLRPKRNCFTDWLNHDNKQDIQFVYP